MVDRLTDQDPNIRRMAAEELQMMGRARAKSAVPALMKRVADDVWAEKSRFVQLSPSPYDPLGGGKAAALNALKVLAPSKVPEALQMATKSRNANVRAWATQIMAGVE
jgi:hypothetical protein